MKPNILMTYCINCKYKIPCSCLEMVNDIIKKPYNVCGEMSVVNNDTFYMALPCYTKLFMEENWSSVTTTYSTSDINHYLLTGKKMMEAIDGLKPLAREFKQSELKTEFLKNKWRW